MTNYPYIGFEGPIGVGKTTLAQLLAAHTGATLILEDFDRNEFLPDFYKDKPRWSLGMQLWFLASRHEQLSAVELSRTGPVVADHTYAKDAIFAHLLLKDRELRLYNRIALALTASVPQPDLVVYLDADNDVLLDRIRRRNRDYEASIDQSYLESLRDGYERHLVSTAGLKVLRYDTSTLNLESESELRNLCETILTAHSDRR